MDLNGILDALTDFFTTDLGRTIKGILKVLWQIISPSNAPGAHEVPLPEPKQP